MENRYNDYVGLAVLHGKHDVYTYTTFLQGLKLTQYVSAEQAQNVLAGLRATTWKETHMSRGNKEIWKFVP